jgi:hypothetical protein
MLTRSNNHRSQPQRKGRADHGPIGRRPRFETLEDRWPLSLTAAVDYPVGTNPEAVVAADFNNDGALDLVTGNTGSDNISVRLGDG